MDASEVAILNKHIAASCKTARDAKTAKHLLGNQEKWEWFNAHGANDACRQLASISRTDLASLSAPCAQAVQGLPLFAEIGVEASPTPSSADAAAATGAGLGVIVLVFGAVFLYFLPAVVASARRHHQTGAIFVLNLFLGWTFLGWIAALVWAATAVRPELRPQTR